VRYEPLCGLCGSQIAMRDRGVAEGPALLRTDFKDLEKAVRERVNPLGGKDQSAHGGVSQDVLCTHVNRTMSLTPVHEVFHVNDQVHSDWSLRA
jgi:hypothetical protein